MTSRNGTFRPLCDDCSVFEAACQICKFGRISSVIGEILSGICALYVSVVLGTDYVAIRAMCRVRNVIPMGVLRDSFRKVALSDMIRDWRTARLHYPQCKLGAVS